MRMPCNFKGANSPESSGVPQGGAQQACVIVPLFGDDDENANQKPNGIWPVWLTIAKKEAPPMADKIFFASRLFVFWA